MIRRGSPEFVYPSVMMTPSTVKDRIPVAIWAALLSTLCMIVGWNWDISWHRSVGRDTVWTPAHVAIYVSLAIAFAYNAWLVLSHTFGQHRQVSAIRVLGFSGPCGAFITLWAIFLQATAIVFDNWWHDAYGLDVIVFSPPHYMLSVAIAIFHFGQFVVVASYHNTARPEHAKVVRWVVLIIWSFLISHQLITDNAYGPLGVRSKFFLVTCALFIPYSLTLIQTYLNSRYAGVVCALLYFGGLIVVMQIFQLFPTTPGFGPVYHRVSFLLPPPFPLLLFIPAFAISLILGRREGARSWGTYLMAGLAFVVVFTGVNWVASGFLTSEWGNNRFFAGGDPASAFFANYRQVRPLGFDAFSGALAMMSVFLAAFSAWSGVWVGRWLRRVVR